MTDQHYAPYDPYEGIDDEPRDLNANDPNQRTFAGHRLYSYSDLKMDIPADAYGSEELNNRNDDDQDTD